MGLAKGRSNGRTQGSGRNSFARNKSSIYGEGGGNILQGIAPTNGRQHDVIRHRNIRADGNEITRQTVFAVNMLGGIGANRSQFRTANSYAKPDGVKRFEPYYFWSLFPGHR